MEIKLNWTEFKNSFTSLQMIYYDFPNNGYHVWVHKNDFTYFCNVHETNEQTDFESNYKSSATNFTDLKLNTNTVIQQSIKTFHKFDNNVIEKNVTNESDVLFKTITLSNKYLKEILISVVISQYLRTR